MATRMSISLPATLKHRMDKVEEPLNWSALACRAFEAKLGEVASAKKEKQMSDVIERLRATRIEINSVLAQRGRELGLAWAKDDATAQELELLAKFFDEAGRDAERALDPGESSAYGSGETFVFIIRPNDEKDRQAATDFWDEVFGDNPEAESFVEDPVFVVAFAQSAVNLWGDVAGQI